MSQVSLTTARAEGSWLKKGLCMLAVAMIGAALVAPVYSQTAGPATASAQGKTPELHVAVWAVPPFIMGQNGSLTGFSIELWDAIAALLRVKTSYQNVHDASALEDAMRSKEADLTVTPVFITSARDEVFDFSYPIMEAGPQIMLRGTGERAQTANPLSDLLLLLFSRTTALWLGVALLIVLIPAHLIWLLDRRSQDGIASNRSYYRGIFEVIYWGLLALTSQAQTMPSQWAARALSICWMDIRRCGFRCAIYRPANREADRSADSRRH